MIKKNKKKIQRNKKKQARKDVECSMESETELKDEKVPMENMEDIECNVNSEEPEVWNPNIHKLQEGEELIPDLSAYNCLESFSLGDSCLSFDFLKTPYNQNQMMMDDSSNRYPFKIFFTTGTQTPAAPSNRKFVSKYNNKIIFTKLSNLKKINKKPEDESDSEESDSESSSDDDDIMNNNDSKEKPKGGKFTVDTRYFWHGGCVNRIRSMPQIPHIVSTWSDSGYVAIWDGSEHLKSLEENTKQPLNTKMKPIISFAPFKGIAEGYAIEWSPLKKGGLLTGDTHGRIYIWNPTESTWIVDKMPYTITSGKSVEDIQFSPCEKDIFACCSVDHSIQIVDLRSQCAIRSEHNIKNAHDNDVNVISWNKKDSNLILSGGDDCKIKVWDLRMIKLSGNSTYDSISQFLYHKSPITSVDWNPNDESSCVVSSEDNFVSFWDFSLEDDLNLNDNNKMKDTNSNIQPSQLLFVHYVKAKEPKELHFHSNIPSFVGITGQNGFEICKPGNI